MPPKLPPLPLRRPVLLIRRKKTRPLSSHNKVPSKRKQSLLRLLPLLLPSKLRPESRPNPKLSSTRLNQRKLPPKREKPLSTRRSPKKSRKERRLMMKFLRLLCKRQEKQLKKMRLDTESFMRRESKQLLTSKQRPPVSLPNNRRSLDCHLSRGPA